MRKAVRSASVLDKAGDPLPLRGLDCTLVLADAAREGDSTNADSHSLATLLMVRDLQVRMHTYSCPDKMDG